MSEKIIDRPELDDLGTYEFGWSDKSSAGDTAKRGISEEVVKDISGKKDEPEWMLARRLKGYDFFLKKPMPTWGSDLSGIHFDNIKYFVRSTERQAQTWEDLPEDIRNTYEKLGIPLREVEVLEGVVRPEGERKIAVDAVFDSVSVATTFREELKRAGVIFLSISEAIREYPDMVKKWLGKVVPVRDNYFAALNCAVFSDGTFVYVPEGVRCPMELSTYFRINAENTGQFERTLIIADKDRCLLDVWGPLRQAFDVKHRLVAVPRRGPHDRVLAGVIGHRRPPLARTLPVVELAVAFPLAIHNRSSASLIPERSRAASTS